jgi:hypothetical protein
VDETGSHIKRSPEMYLVGYAMARAGVGGQPPAWLGVSKWNEAYDLFLPSLGQGRAEKQFRNSLKNARDSFDGFFKNGRVGWRQSSKIERPPAPNRQVETLIEAWNGRSEAELRDAVLSLLSKPSPRLSPEHDAAFDPHDETDARRRVLAEVARRQGQKQFRDKLLKAYGGACCVSGCDVLEVLEAAHIRPYTGPHRNVVTNGLLLRADLHTLFDLRLLRIDPETMLVNLSADLLSSRYAEFHLKPLRLPSDLRHTPDRSALGLR